MNPVDDTVLEAQVAEIEAERDDLKRQRAACVADLQELKARQETLRDTGCPPREWGELVELIREDADAIARIDARLGGLSRQRSRLRDALNRPFQQCFVEAARVHLPPETYKTIHDEAHARAEHIRNTATL